VAYGARPVSAHVCLQAALYLVSLHGDEHIAHV
jgi:hypothetical protein